ncbi:MAG: glycosyltransferase family 4 protein [Lachnospiraceae bacterium]|nr:glycosyltransferase family 4 protein [Lachnospiraceae bacterium]
MKKHILILCLLGNPYQKAEGGFHKTVYEIIEYFKEKDIAITVITSNTALQKDKFQQKYSNIRFYELALDSNWVENQDQLYVNSDYLVKKIQQIIQKNEAKISLIHSLQWINGYLATKINSPKETVHIHSIISSSFDRSAKGFSLRSQYQRQCEELAFNAADVLISITEAERQQLIEGYHIPSSKILIMGREVDSYYSYFYGLRRSQICAFDKLKYNEILQDKNCLFNQKTFIYIGRIIEYKGIREILTAWHILYTKYKKEVPPLWLVGGTPISIYEFHDTLIKDFPFLGECEKNHKIYWWGYMEHYGISTLLQKAHVLLMHSAFEPGGRVLLEAMSSGKPIIATPEGFAQTYLTNWYNGFQVAYQDIERLAHCMEFFIKNEYLSSMLGINAHNTHLMLKSTWKYYEKLDALYHLDEKSFKENFSSNPQLEIRYPLLIDEFPYCDIKNDLSDLFSLLNCTSGTVEELTKHNSFIWKIFLRDKIYFAKQVYNQVNLKQLWNPFDFQKVHTIWMQYHTSIISTKYSCIISPAITSDKLFTYLLPICEILTEDQTYKIYPALLAKLKDHEGGTYMADMSYNELMQYFKKINHEFQYKHKYYTLNTYSYELKNILEENKSLFQTDEIAVLNYSFQVISQFIFFRKSILYGLNYGKTFVTHVISQEENKYLLLPGSDIFIGELGQDEGILFASYYLKNHIFLTNSYYPRKSVLIWSLLYCMELLIESRILLNPKIVSRSDLEEICNAINNEK